MSLVGAPDARQAGRRHLHRAAAEARRHGVAVSTRLLEGAAPTTLANAAEGSAMLVVGSHGHRGMTKVLFGSVSRSCIQHASFPVVVIPPHSAAPRDAPDASGTHLNS